MIKLDLTKKILDKNNNEMGEITIGSFLGDMLWNQSENQTRAILLAKKIIGATEIELKAEDVAFLKDVIIKGKTFAGVVGQIIEAMGETLE